MFHKIRKLRALPFYILWAEFEDGRRVFYNVGDLFDRIPAFRAFEKMPGLFETVQIAGGGWGVEWNDDLDLDGEEIYEHGRPDELLPQQPERGEHCPVCGQMIRRRSARLVMASRANGRKGGRPRKTAASSGKMKKTPH